MRKKLVVLSVILVFCVIVTASNTPNACGAEPILLKASGAWPETSLFTPMFFNFFDIVKRRSNGRVQIKWVGGPEFVKVRDLPRAAATGTIDVFQISLGYLAGSVPEGAILDAYPLYRSYETEPEVYYECIKITSPLYEKRLKIKQLGLVILNPFFLWTRKQVTKMEDIKGLKIRAHGGLVPFIVEELGGNPITTPTTEVYTALERGIIDGAVRNIPAINSFREYELCHYAVSIPVTWAAADVMISLRAWNKLPKDLQDVLWESGKEMTKVSAQHWENLNENLRKKFPEQNIKFFDPPEDMKKAWMEAIGKGGNKAALKLSPKYGESLIMAFERAYKKRHQTGR